jgi:hypothetical protein
MRHFTVINILLVAVVLSLSVSLYRTYRKISDFTFPTEEFNTRINTGSSKKTGPQKPKKLVASPQAPPQEYSVVSEKNLFHPDRKPRESKTSVEEAKKEKPDIIIYGTILSGNTRLALIEDKKNPLSTPGRGKRQRLIKEQDEISGYKVLEITESSILIGDEDDSFLYRIEDSSKEKHKKPLIRSTVADKKKERKKTRRPLKRRRPRQR